MKVGFASNDWSQSIMTSEGIPVMGGSGWIRIGQYLQHLRTPAVLGMLAWHPDKRIFGVHEWLKEDHFDCDVIYLQRFMDQRLIKQMAQAQANGQIIINDIDDWYWGISPANAAFRATHPTEHPTNNINHYGSIVTKSDYLVVSTRFLVEKMARWVDQSRIMHLVNHVEFDKYIPRHHHGDEVIVGWCGSTRHRSGDLELLRGVLSQLPDSVRFHHTGEFVGSPTFAERIGVDPQRVSTYPFLAPSEFAGGMPFDIGLAPLTDTPFNHAKSWIKCLEYAAAGIPFIASNLPEYAALVNDFGAGRIARKPFHWVTNVLQLLEPSQRKAESEATRKALAGLDVRNGAKQLDAFFRSIA